MDVAKPNSETQAFFESFRLLEAQRPDFDRVQLLSALGVALEKTGHVRLVRATAEPPSSDLSGLFVPVLFWGLGASAGVALGAPWPVWIALSFGIAIGYGLLAAASPKTAPPVAGILMLAWAGAAVALGMTDPGEIAWTHGSPIAAALVLAVALRSLRLREARDVAMALAGVARSAPYVAPVAAGGRPTAQAPRPRAKRR